MRHSADQARRPRISGIFEGGATPAGEMHRWPNAAALTPRVASPERVAIRYPRAEDGRIRGSRDAVWRRASSEGGPTHRTRAAAAARCCGRDMCSGPSPTRVTERRIACIPGTHGRSVHVVGSHARAEQSRRNVRTFLMDLITTQIRAFYPTARDTRRRNASDRRGARPAVSAFTREPRDSSASWRRGAR